MISPCISLITSNFNPFAPAGLRLDGVMLSLESPCKFELIKDISDPLSQRHLRVPIDLSIDKYFTLNYR